MLKKLLRYDFRDLFRLFIPATVAVLLTSVLGGLLMRLLDRASDSPLIAFAMGSVGIVCAIALIAYALFPMVWVVYRFYRSFFCDEGHLTFTLPVSVSALLQSKIISGFSLILMGGVVWILSVFVFFQFVIPDFSDSVIMLGKELYRVFTLDGAAVPLAVFFMITIVFSPLLSLVSLFLAFSFSSLKVKKYKVFLGIVFYYLISSVTGGLYTFTSLLFVFTDTAASNEAMTINLAINLWLSVIVGLSAYLLNCRLLKRNLDLT